MSKSEEFKNMKSHLEKDVIYYNKDFRKEKYKCFAPSWDYNDFLGQRLPICWASTIMFIVCLIAYAIDNGPFINLARNTEMIDPYMGYAIIAVILYGMSISGLTLAVMTMDMLHVLNLCKHNRDAFANWIANSYYYYANRSEGGVLTITLNYMSYSTSTVLWKYFKRFHLKHFICIMIILFSTTFSMFYIQGRDRSFLKAVGHTPSWSWIINRCDVTAIAEELNLSDLKDKDPIYIDVKNNKLVTKKYVEEYKAKKDYESKKKLDALIIDTPQEKE